MRATEPTIIYQGESVTWARSFCDFPADEWTLEYRFRGAGAGINVTAAANGTAFTATITGEDSAELSTGKYQWQAWFTSIADAAIVRVGESGWLNVYPGFVADTEEVDLRSPNKQILDALDAMLLNTASSTQSEYEISTPAGTRKIKHLSRKDLLDQRKYFAKLVAIEAAQERMRRTGRFGSKVVVNVRER